MKLNLLALPFLLASVVHAVPTLKVDISVSGNKITCTPTIENGNIADYTFSYQWLRSFQNIKNDIYGNFPNSAFEENSTTLPTVSLKYLKNGIFHWTRCKIIATPKEGSKLYSLSIPKKLTVINYEKVKGVSDNELLYNGDLYRILKYDNSPYKIEKDDFPNKISEIISGTFILYRNGSLSTKNKKFIDLPSPIEEINYDYYRINVFLKNGEIYNIDLQSPHNISKISLLSKAKKIISSKNRFYVRLDNGDVYSWYKSPTIDENNIPIANDNLKNMNSIYETSSVSYILNDQGELFGKGTNTCYGTFLKGCLGVSDTESSDVKKEQKLIFPTSVERIISIDSIYRPSFVKLVDGSLWAWGNSINKDIGIKTYDFFTPISSPLKINLLSPIKELIHYENENFGGYSYLALLENGELYGWGKNIFNSNAQSITSEVPIKIDFPKKIKTLKYNDRFIYITFEDNSTYTDQPNSGKIIHKHFMITDNGNLFVVMPKYFNNFKFDPINIGIPGEVFDIFSESVSFIFRNFTVKGYAITKTGEVFYFNTNEKNETNFKKLDSDLNINPIMLSDEIKIIISDE